MSLRLDAALAETGTRFHIFPQPLYAGTPEKPIKLEQVIVSVPPSQIQPGPADDRMYVVDAVNKLPYSQFNRPPYRGRANRPLKPGPDGHFTHVKPGTREFSCATMYATVRRVLDIWEDYFGRRIEWHFESDFAHLELIPLVEWDNAQSGYGFLEFGYGRRSLGGLDHSRPYCQNFDVLAHELGHSIVFTEVGIPTNPADDAIDYGGMHEASGDLTAIVAVLHFHSVVDRLLENTRGNLFTVNELNRVGELDRNRQIRIAFNYMRMSDVGTKPHDRSLPLTGAIFDVLVEVFQKNLVNQNLISDELAAKSTQGPDQSQDPDAIQREFGKAYKGNEEKFKTALLMARDYLGQLLASTWSGLRPPNFLTYHDVFRSMLRADRAVSDGAHQETIRSCFAWREIALLPDSILLRPRSLRECTHGFDRFGGYDPEQP
jgi:hypothetical protein